MYMQNMLILPIVNHSNTLTYPNVSYNKKLHAQKVHINCIETEFYFEQL